MFTLKFHTDNDAFQAEDRLDTDEVARVLKRVIATVRAGSIMAPIHDVNGNTIGSWSLEEEN